MRFSGSWQITVLVELVIGWSLAIDWLQLRKQKLHNASQLTGTHAQISVLGTRAEVHRAAEAENIALQLSAKQKWAGYQLQIVHVTLQFGWLTLFW